jgi:hypothetical protein
MKLHKKAKLIGVGISEIFGGFPNDLKIGQTYDLTYSFELKEYIVDGKEGGKYKTSCFEWDKIVNPR